MKKVIEISMFYGAKLSVFEKARILRQSMTGAEKILWQFLSKNKVIGFRFKPQHPISRFIADFYCHALKLVFEVDGGIHNSVENMEYDISRTDELEKFDIKVIRFTNEQVLREFESVQQNSIDYCEQRMIELKVPFRGFRGKK
jgi:very-short-patch-repair endonuclease